MADLRRTVEILFTADDKTSGVLGDIGDSLDAAFDINLDDLDFNDVASGLKAVGDTAGTMASSLLSVTAGIAAANLALNSMAAGGIVYATTKAGEFTASMNEIYTLLDISAGEFDSYKAEVLDYSEGSVLALTDIETSLYNLISMGVDYKDSLATLTVIEQLAVATKSSLNEATETLIGTMNAYGASMDESQSYSDTFFTIIKNGKTTLPELASSISQVTGIASSAGIPFETLGAAIAALTASGTPTSQAMTQLKAAIQGIINPTDSAKKAAEALGVDLSATAIEAKGFEGVLMEVYTATGGNIEEMAKLFTSTEALQGVLTLGADKAGVFAGSLEDMGNKAGATTGAFDKMVDNLDLVWQNLLNNFGSVVIQLGSKWEDSSKDLLDAIKNTFAGLGAAIDAGTFDDLVKVVDDAIIAVTENINSIAEVLPEALAGVDFSGFIDSINDIGDALFNSLDGLDLTTADGLESAIQAIVDTFATLNTASAGVIDALQIVVDVITQIINPTDEASELVKGLAEGLELLGSIAEFVFKNLDTILITLIVLKGVGIGAWALGAATQFTILYDNLNKFNTLKGLFGDRSSPLSSKAWDSLGNSIKGLIGLLSGPAGLTALIVGLGAAVVGFSLDQMVEDHELARKAVEANSKAINDLLDQVNALPANVPTLEIFVAIENGEFEEAQKMIDELTAEVHESHLKAVADQAEFDNYWDDLSSLPEEVQTELLLAINEGDLDKVEEILNADYDKEANISVAVDQSSKEQATEELKYWTESGGWETINVPVTSNVDDVKKDIESIPTEKRLEMRLQGDIDKELLAIETNAASLQSAFEWNAKLEIAEVEAQAKIIESTFGSINTSIESTADLMGQALGVVNNPDSFQSKWAAQDLLRDEEKLRQETFELQKKMTEAQVAYMDEKTKALAAGGAEISIDSTGLEPALELVMWEILQKVQIRANENASEFLLGL